MTPWPVGSNDSPTGRARRWRPLSPLRVTGSPPGHVARTTGSMDRWTATAAAGGLVAAGLGLSVWLGCGPLAANRTPTGSGRRDALAARRRPLLTSDTEPALLNQALLKAWRAARLPQLADEGSGDGSDDRERQPEPLLPSALAAHVLGVPRGLVLEHGCVRTRHETHSSALADAVATTRSLLAAAANDDA